MTLTASTPTSTSRWPLRLLPRGRVAAPTRGIPNRPATARGRCRTRPTRTRRSIWETGQRATAVATRRAMTASASCSTRTLVRRRLPLWAAGRGAWLRLRTGMIRAAV
uniref:Uncharacterized protein n=1 Tax=Arundo donax TaxID=35708 RepID=A0A0A9E808_ARUDO